MPNEDATTLYFPEDPNNGGPTLVVDPSSTSMPAERQLPTSIGRYRIIRLLGEGGMGAVYEAEQDQPRRHVALKVIKAAWASPELLRRFVQESHVLGRLHHPGIAQIYEAGSADTGFGRQPPFAMELIHGKPLVEYAEEHKLRTRQRLELMIQVCDAVQHAHQRGIIHRDLKPGNILVDETGRPKILDFGLARITDSEAQTTRQTDLGQVLGTFALYEPGTGHGRSRGHRHTQRRLRPSA
jgi:serine/threonine protein kinase